MRTHQWYQSHWVCFSFCSSCFVASKSEFFQEKSKFLRPESILFKAVRKRMFARTSEQVLAKCADLFSQSARGMFSQMVRSGSRLWSGSDWVFGLVLAKYAGGVLTKCARVLVVDRTLTWIGLSGSRKPSDWWFSHRLFSVPTRDGSRKLTEVFSLLTRARTSVLAFGGHSDGTWPRIGSLCSVKVWPFGISFCFVLKTSLML